MNESSLSDSVVLQRTIQSKPDQKGRVQLRFTLPSERIITSDWIVPSEIKGKVLIAWANAIRAEDAYDIQQRQEREVLARAEKRTRELSSDAPPTKPVPVQSEPSSNTPSGSHSSDPF